MTRQEPRNRKKTKKKKKKKIAQELR